MFATQKNAIRAVVVAMMLLSVTAATPADDTSHSVASPTLEMTINPALGSGYEIVCSKCTEYRLYIDEELVIQRHRFPNGNSEEGCDGGAHRLLHDDDAVPSHGPAPSAEPLHAHAAMDEDEEEMGCRACGGESSCHDTYQDGPCHVGCASGGGGSTEAILAAIATSDAEVLGRLARENSKHVFISLSRRAVQLLDCQGKVEGQFPLTELMVERALRVITSP